MKKIILQFGLYIFAIILGLAITGCGSMRAINIRTENNVSSVLAGGTLRLSASGRSISWSISSTSDGSGSLAAGTQISGTGVLTVAANETALVIYVFAVSTETEQSNVMQIRVVRVNSVNISPANQTVAIGRSLQFRASVAGVNNPDSVVTWRVSSNPAGTGAVTQGTRINNNGVLTVAPNETMRTLYVFGTSVVDPRVSGSVSVTVVVPTVSSVSVSPINQTITIGASLQFRAAVIGTHDPDNTVTWSVSSNPAVTGAVTPGTSIGHNGVLTVASNESLSLLYVIATSTVDPSRFGSVSVTVLRPVVTSVSVAPVNLTVPAGSAIQFLATVTGTNNPDTTVSWRVSSNAAGTGAVSPGTNINSNGLLTIAANETITTLFVLAASVFDPTRSGSAIISVTIPAEQPPSPPTVQPPPTQPPTGRPPTGQPPTGRPPTGQPPTGQPPTGQPPTGRPPTGRPPTEQPPSVQPPADQPPTEQPPTVIATGVIVNPSVQTIRRGNNFQFTATVSGYTNPNPPMSWRVGTNPDGTGAVSSGTSITGNGMLRIGANETATTLYVIATFNPDSSRFGSAVITVTP